jgi:hypothetical protein
MALSIGGNGKVNGYCLVATDGGVFPFGEAPFWGSTGGNNGGSIVTNIVSFPAPMADDPQQTMVNLEKEGDDDEGDLGLWGEGNLRPTNSSKTAVVAEKILVPA